MSNVMLLLYRCRRKVKDAGPQGPPMVNQKNREEGGADGNIEKVIAHFNAAVSHSHLVLACSLV